MSNLDEKILQAMIENKDLPDSPEETYVPGLIKQSFKGPFKVTFFFLVIFTLTLVGLGVYCGYQMFYAEQLPSKINWLAGTLICFLGVVVLRLWFFMELNRLSVIREIKRVEMQLAAIASKIGE